MVKIPNKARWRETSVVLRDGGKKPRTIVKADLPQFLSVRLKGRRKAMNIPWSKVYLIACLMGASRIRSEKSKSKSKNNVKRGA